MSSHRFLFLFVLFIILQKGQSQELFPLQNYETDVYNGETQNWDICQSDKKIIYIANNEGLLEFNGSNWKLYPSPNHSIMRSVFTKNNRIYTGNYMEFGYWEKDEFLNLKYVKLSNKIKDKLLQDEQFWKITSYQQWILFQSLHRIYIYDTVKQTFRIINSKTNLPKIFVVDNQIYFQKMNEGVFRLENGKSLLITNSTIFKENILINIFSLGNKLLMQTQEKGFFIYDDGIVSPWQTESSSKINSLSVYSSLQLHDGGFALGTIGEGVFLLSASGKITAHIDKSSGLQNNTVLSLFEDADNNIWCGLDNGISVINYASPFRVFYDAEGVFGTVYAASYYQGYLYLGTNQGLFYKTANADDHFKLVKGTKGQVWMLKKIENTLFCGHNSGTFIIEKGNAKLICNDLGTWDIKPVENNPKLLLQGNYEGLNILEKNNNSWHFRNKIKGFDISSRYFEIMPNNQIFVSHEYKGVFKLIATPDYTKVIKIEKDTSAIPGANSSIIKYNGNILYFANGILFEYNVKNRRFNENKELTKVILEDDCFSSGKMMKDDNQALWFYTKNNITAISAGKINNEPSIHRISFPLSIRKNVVGYENLLHLGNDIYLFGTTNGYVLFNLNKISEKENVIQINSIEKNKLNSAKSYIPILAKNYKVKSSENNIKFSYSVPVFDKFTVTIYQYRLEGMYDEWSEWTNQSETEFKNLPSGTYKFQVRAKVGNKLTSNIASFQFSVSKPWYVSGWMMSIYTLLFILMLLWINLIYRKRYDKKIEKINQEKMLFQLKNEKEIIKLKNENLNNEVESINRELALTTMTIVKKNELLNDIKLKLQQESNKSNVESALKIINKNSDVNNDWEAFQEAFNNTDRDFLKKLKEIHPTLTPNDLKLCVYLRLNLSSKEIAPMLNISPQSVEIKRFRLRKKMELGHEENLTDYILSI